MKIGKATGAVLVFLLTMIGLVYATTITTTTISDATWINGTALHVDEIWIDGTNYTKHVITAGVNDSFITPSRINTTEFRGNQVYVNNTPLYDYIADRFFAPWIETPVIDTGFTFPEEPIEAQLFFRTSDYVLYYFNSSHWVGMGLETAEEPPGGAGGNGTLYYYADFEENDFTDITVGGGEQQTLAGGTLAISSTAYNGSYASNSSIPANHVGTGKATNVRWRYTDGVHQLTDLTEWYFGGSFYLNTGFDGSGYCYLMKLAVDNDSDNVTFATFNLLANGSLSLIVNTGKEFASQETLWASPAAINEAVWNPIVVYVNATLNGEVTVWLNTAVEGAPTFTQSGDFRALLNGTQCPDPGVNVHAGLIQNQATGAGQHNWVLWDELKVADDFDTALPTP